QAMEPQAFTRRSVVKASFSRNGKKGAWTAHAKYLSRPGAQQELARGLGFDSTREQIDMVATVKGWEESDELMWRFIVSPEDANRLNLRDHVRELAGAMERDLGTKLDWVAIDHHNTDDAHVHLLVRGVRENGRPLKIDREYLRSGIRTRSQEILTRELGPRPEREMLQAREQVVRREQWTEIDRAFQHKAGAKRIVSDEHFQPRGDGARVRAEQEIRRLQYLEELGLARRIDERSWRLSENHERELRTRQQSKDVIKTRSTNASVKRARSGSWRGSRHGGISSLPGREQGRERAPCPGQAHQRSELRSGGAAHQLVGDTARRGDAWPCSCARRRPAGRHLRAVGMDRLVDALAPHDAAATRLGSVRTRGGAAVAGGRRDHGGSDQPRAMVACR
ncbi:MAG: relaxase/mobilization nuclease domain-containing protein, partial [Acidimicrobiales bacterium]